jgi:hypothetical protein
LSSVALWSARSDHVNNLFGSTLLTLHGSVFSHARKTLFTWLRIPYSHGPGICREKKPSLGISIRPNLILPLTRKQWLLPTKISDPHL